MRSTALSSESISVRAAFWPPSTSSPRPLKFSHNSSSSNHNPSPVLSRSLRQRGIKLYDGRFRQFLQSEGFNSNEEEFKIDRHRASKLIQNLDGCSVSDIAISNHESPTEKFVPAEEPLFFASSYMKFVLLIGVFALQGSPDSCASSDFAAKLQSTTFFGDLGDISTGFASAFLLIFFSELGDKTFFIAALLAARNSAAVVFLGTFGALGVMTIISVFLGRTFHYVDDILPFRYGETDLPVDDIAAVFLLVYFGVSTLLEASSGDGLKAEEEQKEAEVAISELSGSGAGILAAASTVISTFIIVFVAEWGDKSFFSTIALAAASSPLGVIGGALVGHGFATLLAVLGGSLLSTFLSEKVISFTGGSLFLIYAAVTLIEILR